MENFLPLEVLVTYVAKRFSSRSWLSWQGTIVILIRLPVCFGSVLPTNVIVTLTKCFHGHLLESLRANLCNCRTGVFIYGLAITFLLLAEPSLADTIPSTVTTTVVNDRQEYYTSSACTPPSTYYTFLGQEDMKQYHLAQCYGWCSTPSGDQLLKVSAFQFMTFNTPYPNIGKAYYTVPCSYPATFGADFSIMHSCYPGTIWNGSACVAVTHTCPAAGTWILSSDKLTCTGCYDPGQTLNQDNACVGEEDKALGGEHCQQASSSSRQPDWLE